MRRGAKILLVAALAVAAVGLPRALAVSGDVVFPRKPGQATPRAVFPHWFHRIRFRCYVCHPAVFPMKVTNEGVSMSTIMAGESCGKCHNGKIAWAVSFDTCNRCHTR